MVIWQDRGVKKIQYAAPAVAWHSKPIIQPGIAFGQRLASHHPGEWVPMLLFHYHFILLSLSLPIDFQMGFQAHT